MHRIGVVGTSWRQRRGALLAELTIPRESRIERIAELREQAGVEELVYIATCGRVEIAFATGENFSFDSCRRRIFAALTGRDAHAGEADHAMRAWHGEGAAEHLFVVASGLDSARVGESEIAGQIRDSLADATTAGTAGPRLERVFTEALRVARRVKPMTEGRIGVVSLAEIAERHAAERALRTGGAVAVVGISPMTAQCAHSLAARGISVIVVNRTLARAEALAREVGGAARQLDAFRAAPDAVEVVVLATGAPEPVLGRADLERLAARTVSGEPPLVIDLGVPPNVAPEAAEAADVRRIGIDRISEEAAGDRDRLLLDFADARTVIDDALVEFRKQTAERLVGPAIAQLRLGYRRTALEGVDRLLSKSLPNLGDADRETLRRWAETLASRLAHVPSIGLRDLAFTVGPAAVEAFFESSDPATRALLAATDNAAGSEVLESGGGEP
ncbi:MAG: glutamyl-tRNA reductase [Gemmatimonadaceae bacterium]